MKRTRIYIDGNYSGDIGDLPFLNKIILFRKPNYISFVNEKTAHSKTDSEREPFRG